MTRMADFSHLISDHRKRLWLERGLRHGCGVGAMQGGVPLPLIQRWMGHARLWTTAVYLNGCGPEECGVALTLWQHCIIPYSRRKGCHANAPQH